MTVEQPAFERVLSVSELQIFPAHFKLQYLHICFIPCFIITDISRYISVNRITNSERVIDIKNKNFTVKILTRYEFGPISFQFLKSTLQCDIFKIFFAPNTLYISEDSV